MAGDVATAGAAGTGVTRVHAGQQEQSESELQAAENGVASPAAAPDDAQRRAKAGSADGGSTPADPANASTADAGSTDVGSTDADSTDAGSTDADSTEAGSADAGTTDAGPKDGDASAAAELPAGRCR